MKEKKKVKNVHDKLFTDTFNNPENVRAFLKLALPATLLQSIDLSVLALDQTKYVDRRFIDSLSDLAVKTRLKTGTDTDIYMVFEHKSYRPGVAAIFMQVLSFMYLKWQKDLDAKKPLSVIIPLVFYHGKEEWNIPRSFNRQFDVPEEIREFLLDYKYVLFDTADWDFHGQRNAELKDNVFLLTALAAMKSAFNNDMESIAEIFNFWREKGFASDTDKAVFFLTYISETRDISQDTLKKALKASQINGGDIMPTLAQRLRKEGEKIGEERGEERGEKRGIRKEKLEMAKRLLMEDMSVEKVASITGLTIEEVKSVMN
jgi:predicted transposase/invertase (TIGR01784 family)